MFGKRKKIREFLNKKFGVECPELSKERTKARIDLIALFHKDIDCYLEYVKSEEEKGVSFGEIEKIVGLMLCLWPPAIKSFFTK